MTLDPDPLIPYDPDSVWAEGYNAGFDDAHPTGQPSVASLRATFALGIFVGVIVGTALTILIGHASAAPRPEPASSIPVAAQVQAGASLAAPAADLWPQQPREPSSDAPPSASASLSGTASWYPARGLIAAAGPALRTGNWRGRQLVVSANGRSLTVTLADWCQCYGTRLLDLSDDAFARLAPLSRGLVRVQVSSSGPAPTLPPTDAIGKEPAA